MDDESLSPSLEKEEEEEAETSNAGFAIVTQASVASAASGENAYRSYYPFPAVSQCLFFHQSIPVAVGVPGVTRSERMCKHNKSRKLTENQAEIFSSTEQRGFFIYIQFISGAEIRPTPSPNLSLNGCRASVM